LTIPVLCPYPQFTKKKTAGILTAAEFQLIKLTEEGTYEEKRIEYMGEAA
jgi:hypothetical protein